MYRRGFNRRVIVGCVSEEDFDKNSQSHSDAHPESMVRQNEIRSDYSELLN